MSVRRDLEPSRDDVSSPTVFADDKVSGSRRSFDTALNGRIQNTCARLELKF